MRLARSTRCNLLAAKNAMDLLSGDQNGYVAPSVPGISNAVPSSGRIQSPLFPFEVPANAAVLPSGDKAMVPLTTLKLNLPSSGGSI